MVQKTDGNENEESGLGVLGICAWRRALTGNKSPSADHSAVLKASCSAIYGVPTEYGVHDGRAWQHDNVVASVVAAGVAWVVVSALGGMRYFARLVYCW